MVARTVVGIGLLLSLAGGAAQELKPAATLTELQQRITDCVGQSNYAAALWGVKVTSLDTGKTVFEHNAGKLFSPASNSKLYTVALALDRLGEDYRIKTSLYSTVRPRRSGTLKGDLIVFGRGDPTLNQRLHGSDIFKALEPLVLALKDAGVKRITGDLVGDQSYFRGPEFGSGWAWDDMQYYYGAELSALTVNDNVLQVTVKPGAVAGSSCTLTVTPATSYLVFSNRTQTVSSEGKRKITFYRPLDENIVYVLGTMPAGTNVFVDEVTFHNPAGLFVSFLREALKRQGIKVTGKTRTLNWLDRRNEPLDIGRLVELGTAESLSLREVAREIQKPSQNLYTDLLLAHVGEAYRTGGDAADTTSEELGIRELNRFLAEAGVPKGEVIFEEGSGLSRDNLTSPNATVTLLKYMKGHKCGKAFIDALPVAGVDGTLRNRMKNTAAAGNVRAKTGSLRWSSSLSGYVTTAGGEQLVFSLMLNRYDAPAGTTARAGLDAIAVLLAGFTGHS
ncbi:MAG TPA: D-alanyl-D-alanine carboxypeptidase/D-alanyl-D-alanine-endopeptidase [Verrucomicrobiae bacterium]